MIEELQNVYGDLNEIEKVAKEYMDYDIAFEKLQEIQLRYHKSLFEEEFKDGQDLNPEQNLESSFQITSQDILSSLYTFEAIGSDEYL